MKKMFVVASILMFQVVAQAGYVGKMGPFVEDQVQEIKMNVRKCDTSAKELRFEVEKNGKYHMARVVIQKISVTYNSGATESFDGRAAGEVKGFAVDLAPNQCVTQVSVKAKATGFNTSGSNDTFVSVWSN